MNTIHALAQYLNHSKLITDGSFGTYYADQFDTNEMPELANADTAKAERVRTIHKEYIDAGAKLDIVSSLGLLVILAVAATPYPKKWQNKKRFAFCILKYIEINCAAKRSFFVPFCANR